jgi:prepilin-type N-terminal cleavage/methylation domain-containing protein
MRRRGARGYTLIELMIAVAIIGMLASMALPGFQKLIYRARERERIMHFNGFKKALIDEFRTTGKLPNCTGMTTPQAGTLGTVQNFDRNLAGPTGCFRMIPYSIDGGTRYRWTLMVLNSPPNQIAYLYVQGDVNMDGNMGYYYFYCQPDEKTNCKAGSWEWMFSVPVEDPDEMRDETGYVPPANRFYWYY